MTATQDHPAISPIGDVRLHEGVDDGTATGPVDPSAELVKVPVHRYTSSEFADLELKRLWNRTWQLACCVDHVAAPGDFFEYRVGPYAVVVVRDADGELRAFQNACRHRGNSLCSGAGSGLTELRCGYHGWTWDLAGQLRRVPGRKGFGQLKMSEFPLIPAQVDTWGPFVFVNLDVTAPALDVYLEGMPDDTEWARVEEFRCTASVIGDVAANWKTITDGFSETYHIQTLHPELLRNIDDVNAPQRLWGHTGKSEQLYGLASPRFKDGLSDQEVWDSFIVTQGQRMGITEACPVPEIPAGQTLMDVIAEQVRRHVAKTGTDLSGFDTDRIMRLHQYQLFPNCSVLLTADTLSALVARPGTTPGTAEMGIFAFRRAASADAPYTRPMDLRVAFEELDLGYVLNQDAAVLAGIQRGLNQPGLTEMVLSQEEKRVINTHRNLEHYLGIGPRD